MNLVSYMQDAIVVIAFLTAVVGAFIALYRKVIKPVAEAVDAIKDVVEMQLKPNGGGALVDKVNRIAPNHAAAERHWDELKMAHREIKAALDERTDITGVQIARIDSKLTNAAEEQADISDRMNQRDSRIEIIDTKITDLTAGQLEIRDIVASHTLRLDKIEGAVVKP